MDTQSKSPSRPDPSTGDFYISAATSAAERRPPRALKHGDTFAVFDDNGDVTGGDLGPAGLYYRDTRHLSHFVVSLDGDRPLLLSSTVRDDNAVLSVDLANPDLHRGGRLTLPRDTIHIRRTAFLWRGACYLRLAVHNFDRQPRSIRLGLEFAADFRDLFEIRGSVRERRGTLAIERHSASTVVMRYRGLDDVVRTTRLDFAPAANRLTDDAAEYDLTLAPGERASFFLTVRCDADTPARPNAFFGAMRAARRDQRAATSRAAVIDGSNAVLNRILCRSVADIYMLLTDTPEGAYPYAGIPWFSTPFGRDGIITALELLWFDPAIAKGVLRFLAATQADHVDPEHAAQPGKILHEMRQGEMARLGEVPFGRYYGTVDATPLFVLLAGRYFARTDDRETIKALWPHIDAALRWIDRDGDPDRDGFVEYAAVPGKGLFNQGWKDSEDAISHADGTLAHGAIALCEVQAYVYGAKRAAAAICRTLGMEARAAELEDAAQALRRRFDAAFWCEDLGTYALALDGDKRPCRVVSSNAGHALFAGIAEPSRARQVAASLLGRESFSGWGVRTLAASARRYNPMSYHNGSVWPHDNALVALGLARYGLKREALAIFDALFAAVQHMDLLRPPELFCGFPRRHGVGPTRYPVACSPQAWASATPLALVEACLGLHCDSIRGEIRLENPILPQAVEELRLRRVRIGDGEVDLLLRRHDGEVAVTVLRRHGDIRVIVVN
ncbi:MAG: amylo-alpha-1,6-glucosidase [Alphaproteobacteria bacterium]|nr:amylo-alpha-1,6-glucosidase [Alphaproteobacteria bacterium]